MHRHRDSVNMTDLSDNVNTDALRRGTPNGDPLPGYHIYSRSERHANRVSPAFLSYQRLQYPIPSKPRWYPNERSRLLHEGLLNNGRFVFARILTDLEDERRAEEVRAKEALDAEHAALKRKEEAKKTSVTGATPTEADEQTEIEDQTKSEKQITTAQPIEVEQQIETEQQIKADQSHERAPSFDPEFDEDRGIFSDPLAEFNGADPFADFDGDYTHLNVEIDYGSERGNLSDSDSDDDSGSEEDSSSEGEFDGADPFTDFDGDHTYLHVPFDFEDEQTDKSESGEDSVTSPEQGRAPESGQDVNWDLEQDLEEDYEQDHNNNNQNDENMDSMDEILAAHAADFTHEDEDEDEDMGDDVDLDYEDGEDIGDEDEHDMDSIPSAPFNPIAMGLKEIGGLAHFRVSSYKPGNGVDELKNDDIDRYWQYVSCNQASFFLTFANKCHRSDGVQPHRLTMAFVKQAEIRALRFYVDYLQDESYTPTKIIWKAGTSENNLFKFAESELVNPSGWVDVPITGAGGGEDGNSLMAWVVRMEVIENHQNGKDTHIRSIKIYGFDDQLRAAGPTTGGVPKEGGADGVSDGFKMDEMLNAEENEKALMAHLRIKDFERSMGAGDPSGTASSLDFIEDPVLR